MIDLHCHIVPGVDDGSPDIETSLAMIRQARQAGVTAILTTPHIRSHPTERGTHLEHQASFDRLKEAQANSDVRDVDLRLGCEVRVTSDALSIVEDKQFTYGEAGRYILLELPSQEVPPHFSQTLFEFRLRGVTPIVAHPERNLAILKRPAYAVEFVRQGAHLQLTTSSINGELGPTMERASLAMIRAGIVSFIASDSHNLSQRSFLSWTRTREALERQLGESWAGRFERMSTTNPNAVLTGSPIELLDVDADAERSFLKAMAGEASLKSERKRRFFFF